MSIVLFLIIFATLSIGYLILGYFASKDIKTTTDYFLAGRDLGTISVTFSLIATQLGGGMLLGTSQQAYSVGWYGIMYTLGMCIGFLILGCGLASKLQKMQVATTAEIFKVKYKSNTLKLVASLLSIATLFGIVIAQIIASKTLLVGMGINQEWIFLVFWAFVIGYTMIGGLKAVVITDVFQVWFIILLFGALFLYCLFTESASFFTWSSLVAQQQTFASATITNATLFGALAMPALFSLIEQDLAQRFFAARTSKIAALSALFASGFLLLFSVIPIYFGMKANILGIFVPAGGSPLIPFLESFASNFVVVLAVCAIIAAITSTADSLLCAVSSNVAQDFDFSWTGIKNKVTLSQLITGIIGVIGIAASYVMPSDIIGILIGSYEISVCCLLVPLLFAYFRNNVKTESAYGAIICGFFGFIIFRFIKTPIPRELTSLMLSFAGYTIGTKTLFWK